MNQIQGRMDSPIVTPRRHYTMTIETKDSIVPSFKRSFLILSLKGTKKSEAELPRIMSSPRRSKDVRVRRLTNNTS